MRSRMAKVILYIIYNNREGILYERKVQMNTPEYKRALLYRKAQGNIHRKKYVNKINYFTGEPVLDGGFLNLEDTDLIIERIKTKKVGSSLQVEINDSKELIGFIKEKIDGIPFYLLIDEEWKFCGAYKTNGVFSECYDFDKLSSDEIRVIPCDLSFQIQIDYDNSEIECEYINYI